MKSVAVIGTSGGGAAGEFIGPEVVETIANHLSYIQNREGVNIRAVIFIVCGKGIDFSTQSTLARLYVLNSQSESFSLVCIRNGTLASINAIALQEDSKLAASIKNGDIDALISMSSDPEKINFHSCVEAIAVGIPIVGTGGKSMSHISSSGGNVIGSSGGSVASTSVSRAICFSVALATYWRCDILLPKKQRSMLSIIHSIIGAALPILLSSSLILFCFDLFESMSGQLVSSYPHVASFRHHLSSTYIGVAISMIACNQICHLNELAYLAGACAGVFGGGGILPSLVGGLLSGLTLPYVMITCARWSLLPTATTIISAGGASVVGGAGAALVVGLGEALVMRAESVPVPSIFLSYLIKLHSHPLMTYLIGSILGFLVSWGSENGYYHTVMLPVIALEMVHGGFGVFGCLDAFCLCAPCAGVCAAVFIYYKSFAKSIPQELQTLVHKREAQIRLGWRGLVSNFLMGDFVEACYPYSLRHESILRTIRLACCLAGGTIYSCKLASSAYLPLSLSLLISVVKNPESSSHAFFAVFVAIVLPFLATFNALASNDT
jgi:hypothetical protein